MITLQKIIWDLNINEEILNVYPYGSRVYGCADKTSDYDFVVVTKGAMLESGAFRQNAISSRDRKIQGVLFSRGGFIDAINNYEITALECLSLDPSLPLQSKWPFKIQKWNPADLARGIIKKTSDSWHAADMRAKDGDRDVAKVGIYHALRILEFGLQLKKDRKITDFSAGNKYKKQFASIPDEDFDTRDYIALRDKLMETLKLD